MSDDAPAPPANTRRHPRTPVALLVQYRLEMSDAYETEYSVDLSPGGIYLRSDARPPVGSLVQLQFSLRDGSQLIEAIGKVIRVSEGSGGLPGGIAVEFVQSDPESRALIEQLCQTALRT